MLQQHARKLELQLGANQNELIVRNEDFKIKCQKLIQENEYLLKINKELVDDNNNLTKALKETYG